MPPLFLVMAGGAVGAGLRYEAGRQALRLLGPAWPWGTLFVNVTGGFLMGLLAAGLLRAPALGDTLRHLLGVGVLGGFTTFSAFSLEAWTMASRSMPMALGYVVLSCVGAIGALALGVAIGRVAA